MRQTYFVFSGHRDEIITAIAGHVFAGRAEQNRKIAALIESPLHTINSLVRASHGERKKFYAKDEGGSLLRDKNGDLICIGRSHPGGYRTIRNIIERGY